MYSRQEDTAAVSHTGVFLSQVKLPPNLRSVHKVLTQGFPITDSPSPRKRWNILYRTEPSGKTLVQSTVRPEWGFLLPDTDFKIKEWTPHFKEGDRYRVRMNINPVITEWFDDGKKRKSKRVVVSVVDWLKHYRLGGSLVLGEHLVKKAYESSNALGKTNHFKVVTATVDGILSVTEPDILHRNVVCGIGNAKSYGCGLISLVKIGDV